MFQLTETQIEIALSELLIYFLILGAFAGFFSGLLGIGGGIILVPVLAWIFLDQGFETEKIMLMAVATSLATITITSLSSVYTHHRSGAVNWPTVCMLAPGILIGAFVGSKIADGLAADTLKTIFGVYLLIVTLQMGLELKPKSSHIQLTKSLLFGAGSIIGITSAALGIGGGTLTVPFLTKYRFAMRNAVATSSACGFPIAIAGAMSYLILGWNTRQLPEWSLGYIYLPGFVGIIISSVILASIGAKLTHKLPTQKLKRIFALFVFAVGLSLFW